MALVDAQVELRLRPRGEPSPGPGLSPVSGPLQVVLLRARFFARREEKQIPAALRMTCHFGRSIAERGPISGLRWSPPSPARSGASDSRNRRICFGLRPWAAL